MKQIAVSLLKTSILLLCLLFSIGSFAQRWIASMEDNIFLRNGIKFPSLEVVNIMSGEKTNLVRLKMADLKYSDKPTLITAWSNSYCDPCIRRINELLEAGVDKDFNIITLNIDAEKNVSAATLKKAIEGKKDWNRITHFRSTDVDFEAQFGTTSVPYWFVLDKSFNLVNAFLTYTVTAKELKSLLTGIESKGLALSASTVYFSGNKLSTKEDADRYWRKTVSNENVSLKKYLVEKDMLYSDATYSLKRDTFFVKGTFKSYYNDGKPGTEAVISETGPGYLKSWHENGKLAKHFLYQNGKMNGVSKMYNDKGLLIVEANFVNDQQDGITKEYENGMLSKEVVYKKGEVVSQKTLFDPKEYDEIGEVTEGMTRVKKNKKIGFLDNTGKLAIPIMYEAANGFYEGVSAVKMNGKVGYVSKTNQIVVPFNFDWGSNFDHGVCYVGTGPEESQKFWFIDKKGAMVTPHKYDYIHNEGRFRMAILDKKWGYVTEWGKEIIPPNYSMIHNVSEGFIGAEKNGKWGFFDTTGKEVLPFVYGNVGLFKNGVSIVKKNGFAGVIDKSGNTVLAFNYETLYNDDETGWYIAEQNNKWGWVNKEGKVMIGLNYDYAEEFSEVNYGYAIVTINKKKGMVNKKGELVIAAKYDKIFRCEDGDCAVVTDNHKGMVELKTGRELIEPKYFHVNQYVEGIARVQDFSNFGAIYGMGYGDLYGYVNRNGKEITEIKYKKANDFSEGLAAVMIDDKWGYVDQKGKEVIKLQYSSAEDFEGGKAKVRKDGKSFYINKKGDKVD